MAAPWHGPAPSDGECRGSALKPSSRDQHTNAPGAQHRPPEDRSSERRYQQLARPRRSSVPPPVRHCRRLPNRRPTNRDTQAHPWLPVPSPCHPAASPRAASASSSHHRPRSLKQTGPRPSNPRLLRSQTKRVTLRSRQSQRRGGSRGVRRRRPRRLLPLLLLRLPLLLRGNRQHEGGAAGEGGDAGARQRWRQEQSRRSMSSTKR